MTAKNIEKKPMDGHSTKMSHRRYQTTETMKYDSIFCLSLCQPHDDAERRL